MHWQSTNYTGLNSMSLESTPRTLEIVKEARAHGVDVTTEAYPYIAGMTEISSALLVILTILWFLMRKMPLSWRRPAAGMLIVAGLGWFARMLIR